MKLLTTTFLVLAFFNFLSAQTITIKADACDNVAEQVDEPARFKHSMCEASKDLEEKSACAKNNLKDKIKKEIEYPEDAKRHHTTGSLIVSLLIDEEGDLAKVRIDQPLGDGYEDAVVDVLKTIEKFIPAKQDGAAQCAWIERIHLEFNSVPPSLKNQVFQVVEEMPRFPGCEDIADKKERRNCASKAMLSHVYKNLIYPKEAREKGVEGTVVIRYIIDEEGNIVNPTVLRDIGGGCGEAAMASVLKMPKWIPGKQRGKNVRVYYNLPVKFRLEKSRKRGKKRRWRN